MTDTLLEVEHLEVSFPVRKGLLFDRTVAKVHAVSDVSLTLAEGENIDFFTEASET